MIKEGEETIEGVNSNQRVVAKNFIENFSNWKEGSRVSWIHSTRILDGIELKVKVKFTVQEKKRERESRKNGETNDPDRFARDCRK